MVLSREIIAQINDVLLKNPQGLSITDIVRETHLNRNTAGRYLDKLLISGHVEMHHFGMAKIYALTHRVPVSAVLSISSELIMQLDSSMRIVFINEMFSHFLDTPVKDLIGKNIEYTPMVTAFNDLFSGFLEHIKTGLNGTGWSGELSPANREIIFLCRIAPGVLDNGQKGVTVILEDVTEQKQAEKALRASEERFRLAMEATNDGIWDWNITSENAYVNPAFYLILGYEQNEFPVNSRQWAALIHPDDLNHALSNRRECLENRRQSIEFEYRMKAKDGSWKWILARGKVINRNADGQAVRVIGTHVDLTEHKRLEDIKSRFGRILDSSLNEIYTFDAESLRFLDVNDGARKNLGYTIEELRTFTPLDIKPEFTRESFERMIAPLRSGKLAELISTTIHKRKDGSLYPVEIHMQLARTEVPPVFIAIALDITKRKAAENALKESEEKYRMLVEHSQNGIFITHDGRLIFHNRKFREILGYAEGELDGIAIEKCVAPEDRDMVVGRHYARMKGEQMPPEVYECSFLARDGTRRRVRLDSGRVYFQGKPATTGSIHDITEERRQEEALRQSEERFRSFVENANDIVYSLTPEGIFSYVSPRWTDLLGYETDEVIGKSFEDFIHPISVTTAYATLKKVITTGEKHSGVEYQVRHKNGTWRWQITNASAIRNSRDNTFTFIGIARDITEQKQTDDALRESEEKFRRIFEDGPLGMGILDPEHRYILVNRRFCDMLGYTAEELLGKSLDDVTHPEDLSRAFETLHEIYTGKISLARDEKQYLRKDGTAIWASITITPLRDKENRVTSTISIIEDITERKAAERHLRESERKFHELADLLPQSVWECDLSGNLTFANQGSFEMYRYIPADFEKGLTVWQMISPADLRTVSAIFREAVSKPSDQFPSTIEYTAIRSDGSTFEITMYLSPVTRNGAITGIRGIGIDMTRQKQTEEALRESEDRFRRIFEDGPLGMAILGGDYRFVMVNRMFCDMLGYTTEELLARTFADITHPDFLDQNIAEIKKLYAEEIARYRTEKRYIRKDGSELWGSLTVSPLRDRDGRIVSTLALIEDITERKQSGK